MINNSLKTIILAAGESKRILSSKSKILHTIGGKTILNHVLDNVGKIISKKNVNIVINPTGWNDMLCTGLLGTIRWVDYLEWDEGEDMKWILTFRLIGEYDKKTELN